MASVRVLSRASKGSLTRRWHVAVVTPCTSSSSVYQHTHQKATGITPRVCIATLENCMSSRGFNGEFFRGFAQQVDRDDADSDGANLLNGEAEEDGEEDVDDELSSLWRKFETQKMRAGESVQAVQEWQAQGNDLTKASLGRILMRMTSRRRYLQAFEIMTWIAEERIYDFNGKDHALHITIACRSNRLFKAQEIFDALPAEMRTEVVQGALIGGLAGRNMVSNVERMMGKLKLRSAQTYTMLILMYLRENLDEKVPVLINEMKEAGLELNAFTYLVLLKHKNRLGGLEGIEEEAETALNKIDLEDAKLNQNVLANMMTVYGYLGKLEKVEKIWSILKQLSWMHSSSFISAMLAFGKLGDVRKAEKVFEELLAAKVGVQRPHAVMVGIYAELGLMEKAEETMGKLKKLVPRPWFTAYNDLIVGYLAKEQPEKALSKLQEGYELNVKVRPNCRTVMALMPVFASKKDVEGAEKLFKFFGCSGGPKIYNELLKVYIEAKRPATKFRRRMWVSRPEPNEETMELLKKLTYCLPYRN